MATASRARQRGVALASKDRRVQAVLDVLAGQSLAVVARAHEIDVAVLHRWVRAFVDGGTAAVTNRPLPEAARERDHFLATVAHELRTPLAVAQGWVGLLVDDGAAVDELDVFVAKVDDSLRRLADRVRDFELLAAASLGRIRVSPSYVRIQDLADGLVGRPVVEGADRDTEIYVDPDHFARVLRDLWRAGAAGAPPRELTLSLRRTEAWLEVRVLRTGPSLHPQTLRALFEPFDVDNESTAITTGLYLTRALVVAHGGTLGVDQEGEETAFWVRIPERVPVAPEPRSTT